MLSVPGDQRRIPFDRRTDAPDLVLIESGRSASLDAFNRSISHDSNIQNCATSQLENGRFRTCDSVLRCVTCSVYRLAERRSDLLAGLREASDAAIVSLTRSHGAALLREEWDATEKILRKLTDRSDWSRFKKRHGIDGYAIVVEESRTESWNVHAHGIVTFAHKLDREAVERFRFEFRIRWCRAASAVGYEAVEARQKVRMLRTLDDRRGAVEYVTKQNLLHPAPESRQGRYPADLLAGAHAGDADDLDLYIEYLEAAFNRAMIRSYGRLSGARSGHSPVAVDPDDDPNIPFSVAWINSELDSVPTPQEVPHEAVAPRATPSWWSGWEGPPPASYRRRKIRYPGEWV